MSRVNPKSRVIALLLGIVIVGVFEALLRLAPGLASAPLLIEVEGEHGETLRDLNPEFPRRFFVGSPAESFLDRLGLASQPHLEVPEPGNFRVVLVGGSTAKGYPHPPHTTAAAHLQRILQEAWPRSNVEVLNAGIVAIASFAVARTLEEAMALRPDTVVIYSGHNEFYGVYGASSLRQGGSSIELKLVHYTLMQMRIATLARSVIGALRPDSELPDPREPDSLLEVMASAGPIAPDDTRRELARQNLHQNLTGMVTHCRSEEVPVVLCTLVSNDTGFEPDSDSRFVDLADDDRGTWDEHLARAHSLLSRAGIADRDASQALRHLNQAADIFDGFAFLHFLKGRALAILKEDAQAQVAFVRARDLDTTPWRAPSAHNQTIRQVAAAEDVLLADVEAAFERESPPSGVGTDLMYDHLHPSRSGQVLLAQAIARPLLGSVVPVRSSAVAAR